MLDWAVFLSTKLFWCLVSNEQVGLTGYWNLWNRIRKNTNLKVKLKCGMKLWAWSDPWIVVDGKCVIYTRWICIGTSVDREWAREKVLNPQREGGRVLSSRRAARYWFWDVEATLTFCAQNVSPHCAPHPTLPVRAEITLENTLSN